MAQDVSLAMIARRVREEMAGQRRTHGELARALGMSTQQVGRRLRGEAEFSGTELAGAAEFLDVSLDSLVGRPVVAERAS
jgi:transcriptional regulator with XRE-family HTH domain